MAVSCVCFVLSGRDLCEGPITRPEESYRVCVCVSDREASIMRRSWPTRACCAMGEKVIELEMENSELFTKCRGFRILARNFTSSF